MQSGIYKIENIKNSKLYIGLSSDINGRWNAHLCLLRGNRHHNNHLQNAFNKYGECNFKHSIIEYTNNEKLPEREIYWVNFYINLLGANMIYNQAPAGGGGNGLFGENHPKFKEDTYNFYNDNGSVELNKTANYMNTKYNLDGSKIYMVCAGKRHEVKGWRITETKIWEKRYDFIHTSGIIEYNMLQKDMHDKYKLDSGSLSRLVSGQMKSTKGWKLLKK